MWVQGHPERTAPDAEAWTKDMWGNHLSDRTATEAFYSPTDYLYDEFYDDLISITPFPRLDISPISPLLAAPNVSLSQLRSKSLTEEIHRRRAKGYLARYRRERDLQYKWQEYHLPLTARYGN